MQTSTTTAPAPRWQSPHARAEYLPHPVAATPSSRPATSPKPQQVTLTVTVPVQSASATLAAIEEVRELTGTRLEEMAAYAVETSRTHAAIGLAALAAQFRAQGVTEDIDYAR